MLEIQHIRNEKEAIIEGLRKRNLDVTPIIQSILSRDQQWRETKTELETISAELNKISKTVGELFQRENRQRPTKQKPKPAQ